jgi:hypothetical protein
MCSSRNNIDTSFVKNLPHDIRMYILRFISPLRLVYVNKFFYKKYHKSLMLSKYNFYFEKEILNNNILFSRDTPEFVDDIIDNQLYINYNFNYSKSLIKTIERSIGLNYIYLLNSIFLDGFIILYKINEYMNRNKNFTKWMNLNIKIHDGTRCYYSCLYKYLNDMCIINKLNVEIRSIIYDFVCLSQYNYKSIYNTQHSGSLIDTNDMLFSLNDGHNQHNDINYNNDNYSRNDKKYNNNVDTSIIVKEHLYKKERLTNKLTNKLIKKSNQTKVKKIITEWGNV